MVELNKPAFEVALEMAFEVALEIPQTAKQIRCCRSQRFDCGDDVSQAGPDFKLKD